MPPLVIYFRSLSLIVLFYSEISLILFELALLDSKLLKNNKIQKKVVGTSEMIQISEITTSH